MTDQPVASQIFLQQMGVRFAKRASCHACLTYHTSERTVVYVLSLPWDVSHSSVLCLVRRHTRYYFDCSPIKINETVRMLKIGQDIKYVFR